MSDLKAEGTEASDEEATRAKQRPDAATAKLQAELEFIENLIEDNHVREAAGSLEELKERMATPRDRRSP